MDEEDLAEVHRRGESENPGCRPCRRAVLRRPQRAAWATACAIAGNAGADAESKISALQAAGVIIAESPHVVGETMRGALAAGSLKLAHTCPEFGPEFETSVNEARRNVKRGDMARNVLILGASYAYRRWRQSC